MIRLETRLLPDFHPVRPVLARHLTNLTQMADCSRSHRRRCSAGPRARPAGARGYTAEDAIPVPARRPLLTPAAQLSATVRQHPVLRRIDRAPAVLERRTLNVGN